MASQSSVAQHPQKQRVIDGILAGESVRDIAKSVSPPLSRAAVQRYRQSIVIPAIRGGMNAYSKFKELREETVTQDASADISARTYNTRPEALASRESERAALIQPFLSRMGKKYERYDRLLDKATAAEEPDIKAIAALDAAETRSMDFHARLVGAIAPAAQESQAGINLMIVLPRPGDAAPREPAGSCIDITCEPAE